LVLSWFFLRSPLNSPFFTTFFLGLFCSLLIAAHVLEKTVSSPLSVNSHLLPIGSLPDLGVPITLQARGVGRPAPWVVGLRPELSPLCTPAVSRCGNYRFSPPFYGLPSSYTEHIPFSSVFLPTFKYLFFSFAAPFFSLLN